MINNNLKKRIYTSIALIFLIYLIINFNLILIYSLIVLGVLSIIEFLSISKKILKKKSYLIVSNSFFAAYIFIFCFLFFFFSQFLQLKIILFSLLFACVASDIGGYVFGNIFKGPKLIKISPKKTISGAIGSLFFSSLAMTSSIFYFLKYFNYTLLITAIITSVACQIGDLFFSFLKRKAKIKDTGNFLPGHGGILDRLDGIFIGIPFGYMFLLLSF